MALGPFAIDAYLPSFLDIQRDFQTSNQNVQRTLTSYFIGLAIGQLFYGPASDRWGRRGPLIAGLTLFILATIACAFTRNIHALMAMRFLQAIGGCAEIVIVLAIVRDFFDGPRAVRLYSSLMLVMGVAPILAPIVGTLIATHFGWRGMFTALAIFGGVCLFATLAFIPESHPKSKRVRHSPMEIARNYARLSTHRIFVVHMLTVSLATAALFVYISGSPGVFIEYFQLSKAQFAAMFGLNAAGLIASSQINGYLSSRVHPHKVLRVALRVTTFAGVCLLIATFTGFGGVVTVWMSLFVFLASLGFVFPTTTALAMAPHGKHAGNASALLGFVQFTLSASVVLLATALPLSAVKSMAVVIGGCVALILLIRLILIRETNEPRTK